MEKTRDLASVANVAFPNISERQQRIFAIVRWLSIWVILAALLTIIRALPLDRIMSAINDWIAGLGFWGPVVLALVYVVATVLFVPGTILTLAAGAMFGLGIGTLAASIGSTVGASLAFLIARFVARDKVAAMARRNRRFGAIDRAIEEGGWKIVALLRLSPAIPFNLQNYLYGLTPIRFWPYVLTSWLAMLPGTFLYVYLGHIAGAAIGKGRARTPSEWVFLAVGLLATAAVTVFITRLARRKLHEQADDAAASSDAAPFESDENGDAERAAPRSRTALLAASALLVVAVAGYVHANEDSIEHWFSGLLGPPPVQMQEAYSESASGPVFDHSAFDSLLHEHVDAGGWVNYDSLQNDEAKLDEYLNAVAAAPFGEMGRSDKLALLINAYNAFTLKLILDHQPIDSIMDIPDAERWRAVRWNVGGNTWSLNQIEHEQIRPNFVEPRVHFALVCAAIGCPPLRTEAYDASRLDEQLEQQAQYVHTHETWFELNARRSEVHLTRLYSWYGNDFRQVAGGELQYAARYAPALKQALESSAAPQVKWLPYDWKLNSVENRRPR